MSKKVPLDRLRQISKHRSIREHNPLQELECFEDGNGANAASALEWPLSSQAH